MDMGLVMSDDFGTHVEYWKFPEEKVIEFGSLREGVVYWAARRHDRACFENFRVTGSQVECRCVSSAIYIFGDVRTTQRLPGVSEAVACRSCRYVHPFPECMLHKAHGGQPLDPENDCPAGIHYFLN